MIYVLRSAAKRGNKMGAEVWDELCGLLTDRPCPRSAALHEETGADKAGPGRLFNDVSINKMEEDGKAAQVSST